MEKLPIRIATLLLLWISSSMLLACGKDDDKASTDTTVVKYELTGNYNGRIFVAFTDANGSTASEIVSSLPWSKELSVKNSIVAVGFSGQTSAPNYGISGQTVTAKLYVKNEVKQTASATADANGAIVLPNLATTLK